MELAVASILTRMKLYFAGNSEAESSQEECEQFLRQSRAMSAMAYGACKVMLRSAAAMYVSRSGKSGKGKRSPVSGAEK